MKTSLAALMVSGLVSGVAMAQTQIRIYGVADLGIIRESGSDTRMGSFSIPRIGLEGSEDLGGGMKATFELQQRFLMNDGWVPRNFNWDQATQGKAGREWQDRMERHGGCRHQGPLGFCPDRTGAGYGNGNVFED